MTKSIFDKTIDAERLLELHQTKPSIVNNECSQLLQVTKGEVRFENVSFSYNDRKFTLEGIDFTVKGGSIVAIVGETGGGKSTVLGLVERFHDVRTGRITIDDQDIRSVTQERYVVWCQG
jgi:ABC-type transport system involved in Fe-S cluster assembly fused permease/ATPase subunit